MRLIYQDDEIEITHEPGESRVAIVSFSGVGMGLGGIQFEEFRNSLAGVPNDIYFVKDKPRQWYNSSFGTLSNVLNKDLSYRGVEHVITLGNSMGGFGAIIFAGQLRGCRSAIAFSAQSAVDPAIVPWEQRYRIYTENVARWAGLDATKLLHPNVNYALFFGNDDPFDIRHAARMAAAKSINVTICIFPGAGHDLATYLKQKGVLRQLIEMLVSDERRSLDFATVLRDLRYQVLKPAAEPH